ncbi:MAG: O-antigen ligase domain-containing protein, partial [Muribaculaceae bacterium]|nr:O-antigen ligase domain-containing protein [Muribaculaceae bacterium]
HYLLMKLYSETGDTPRMRKQARILLAKPPKTHSTAVEEMRRDARERLKQNSADHDSGDR